MTGQDLYQLLPALYRLRDGEEAPLKALLEVLAEQGRLLEEDIRRLYDNWFVETAQEWVVPYLGDLLGVRNLHPLEGEVFSLRAYVANTLAYRRRKGTASVLEQLARDTTGWPAHAVEFFARLSSTQHLDHLRPDQGGSASLRGANRLQLVGGPFDPLAHGAEVRRIASGRGRYNIPNVGIFLWRLQAYPLEAPLRPFDLPPLTLPATGVTPRAVGPGRYTFSPLGLDAPLFNPPQTEAALTQLAQEVNVPAPLRRRALADELRARRRALVAGEAPEGVYFGTNAALEVLLEGPTRPLEPEEIAVCNLDWDHPGWKAPLTQVFARPDGSKFRTRVAVDPERGRLFTLLPDPTELPDPQFPYVPQGPKAVSYAYGFSGDLGGGPYNRRASLEGLLPRTPQWQAGVSQEIPAVVGEPVFKTLLEAVQAWNSAQTQPNPPQSGLICLMDSRSYAESLTGTDALLIPEGRQLFVVAADWPVVEDLTQPPPRPKSRPLGRLVAEGRRPHLRGDLEVRGSAPAGSANPGSLLLGGLLLEGDLTVRAGHLGGLRLEHCTLLPGHLLRVEPSATPGQRNERLEVVLRKSICGSVLLGEAVRGLEVSDSLVHDTQGKFAIADPADFALADPADAALFGPPTRLIRSTVLGRVRLKELEASEVIFAVQPEDPGDVVLRVERRQKGCVRFSYVPEGARVPRRYRCQPDLELARRLEAAAGASKAEKDRIRREVLTWLRPSFSSLRYGQPAYGQLAPGCPEVIRTGAEDGSEMGAFSFLKQAQREANLRIALGEYLRFGLEAGLFFVT